MFPPRCGVPAIPIHNFPLSFLCCFPLHLFASAAAWSYRGSPADACYVFSFVPLCRTQSSPLPPPFFFRSFATDTSSVRDGMTTPRALPRLLRKTCRRKPRNSSNYFNTRGGLGGAAGLGSGSTESEKVGGKKGMRFGLARFSHSLEYHLDIARLLSGLFCESKKRLVHRCPLGFLVLTLR
ncbi:hypothetical protein BDY21DRAFT_31515 [Lineolata rhizophorae]|uniref:Secreted protein n=1 Tax=Lineolata rhizophorae TaxID=578093 RepID=A0A6A6P2L7_9PEZI|nr:hypothetical protein BDY21DRAFT_31515 [Lineolata rhizophorae]